MLKMRLQRRIIKILQKTNDRKVYPTRGEFTQILNVRCFLRLNNFGWRNFESKVDDALGDSIAPYEKRGEELKEYYVDYYDEARTQLKVTKCGRDYLEFGGGWERLLEKRSKLVSFIFGGSIGSLIGIVGAGIVWLFSQYKDNIVFLLTKYI